MLANVLVYCRVVENRKYICRKTSKRRDTHVQLFDIFSCQFVTSTHSLNEGCQVLSPTACMLKLVLLLYLMENYTKLFVFR